MKWKKVLTCFQDRFKAEKRNDSCIPQVRVWNQCGVTAWDEVQPLENTQHSPPACSQHRLHVNTGVAIYQRYIFEQESSS